MPRLWGQASCNDSFSPKDGKPPRLQGEDFNQKKRLKKISENKSLENASEGKGEFERTWQRIKSLRRTQKKKENLETIERERNEEQFFLQDGV